MLIVVQLISVLSNWALHYYMLQPIKGTQIVEGWVETKRRFPRWRIQHQAFQLTLVLLLLPSPSNSHNSSSRASSSRRNTRLGTDGRIEHAATRVLLTCEVKNIQADKFAVKTERERGMKFSSLSSLSSPSCS